MDPTIDPQKWYSWIDFNKILLDIDNLNCAVAFYQYTGDTYLKRNEEGAVYGASLLEVVKKYTPRRIVFKHLIKETGIPKTYFDRIIKFKQIKQQYTNISLGPRRLYILKEGCNKESLLKDLQEFYQLELSRSGSKTKKKATKIVSQSKISVADFLKLKSGPLDSPLERTDLVEQTGPRLFDEGRYVNMEYKALIHLYSRLHSLVYKKLGKKETRDREKEILRTAIITLVGQEVDADTFASLEQKINREFNTEISISDSISEDEDDFDLGEISDDDDDLSRINSGSKPTGSKLIHKVK